MHTKFIYSKPLTYVSKSNRSVSSYVDTVRKWPLVLTAILCLAATLVKGQNAYYQQNLVSDLPGVADSTDTNLVNPWGLAFSAAGPFWLSDNRTGLSTLYNSNGIPQALVVTVPTPPGATSPATPTGIIFNSSTNFTVAASAPAHFIFATEDGTISGWNSGTNAVLKVNNSSSAVYKGLAFGSSNGSNYIYAANFFAGTIDVFDGNYNAVTLAGSFVDPSIPAGFAPFNIQNIGGQLYVTYAMQDATKHHDIAGPGNGYVNVFDTSGNFIQRLISQGALNSPWGLAKAPAGFGPFAGALLVGNFGNARINAFDPSTGAALGTLNGPSGNPISIVGLWALAVGNGGSGGDAHTVYFTAGIPGLGNVQDHGLFGSLTALPATFTSITDLGNAASLSWVDGQNTFLLQRKTVADSTNWFDVLTTQSRGAIIPKDVQDFSCFRLQSTCTNTVLAFSVLLSGASEVSPTSSTGQGVGTLSLEGSNLTYFITFSGLSAPATAGHIHAPATTTLNGGVVVPFSVPAATSGSFSGSTPLTLDTISNIVSGLAYVNIHTSLNPGGEIRGQIVPLHMPITLNGASEAPAVATSATASGSLNFVGNQLFYSISFSGLAGPATAAHIHGPAVPGVSGPVLIPLNTPPASTSGSFSGVVSLVPTNLATLLIGQTYINIHSTVNPGGEIRGQIWPIQLAASMNGASESPTNNSAGSGSGFLIITNGVLGYNVSFTNLTTSATASHIHGPALPGVNAGVIIPLSGVPAATSGSFSGTANISSQTMFWILTGQTYVNVHSATFSAGEIRGQVEPND